MIRFKRNNIKYEFENMDELIDYCKYNYKSTIEDFNEHITFNELDEDINNWDFIDLMQYYFSNYSDLEVEE